MADAPILIGDAIPDATVPLLSDGPPMELPSGATLNPDGSVTLTLEYPVSVKYRAVGSDMVVKQDDYAHLVLRRLTGADVRKMIAAKNANTMALALSSGLGMGKLTLLQNVMDATDEAAAGDVVSELLGGIRTGLPSHATEDATGVALPLFFPAVDEAGTVHTALYFKRLTASQRRQAAEAPNLLDWGISVATGMTPKLAKTLVDGMDGADAMAVNQVILFLCGSGRRSGR